MELRFPLRLRVLGSAFAAAGVFANAITFGAPTAHAADTVLKAPVKAGISLQVSHGYNDPIPGERCVIGAQADHCGSQQFGLDFQVNSSDTDVLAPLPGSVSWISGDCLGLLTEDNLNLNVCHFANYTVKQGDKVIRGSKLGSRSTSWIHLSLDNRPTNSAKLPVAFNGAHTIEGRGFDPQANSIRNQYNGEKLTSTNGQASQPSAPTKPTNLGATAISTSAIRVTWQDNANNETYFSVWRWNGSSWQNIATPVANTTSYQDNGLQANTTYYYTVCVGNNAGGVCADGNTSAKTPAQSQPPQRREVTVDDRDGGFQKTGRYWWEAGIGFGGHMFWTYGNGNSVDSSATWNADLVDGRYEVYVFVPRDNATTMNARYEISTKGGVQVASVNQNNYYDAWVSLGTYDLAGGNQQRIKLTDATGESPNAKRKVGFDAVKFTPR